MAEEIITETNRETATTMLRRCADPGPGGSGGCAQAPRHVYRLNRGLPACIIWSMRSSITPIDEALAGYCTHIEVTIKPGNIIEVSDNGRGIPVDIQPKLGIPAVTVVYTVLHAGGKFGGEDSGYESGPGGLHGVGASVVNALSEWLTVRVRRDGAEYEQSFKRGKPDGDL